MTSIPKDGVLSSSSERLAEPTIGSAMKLKGFSRFFIAKSIHQNALTDNPSLIQIRHGLYGIKRQPTITPFRLTLENTDCLTFIPRRDNTILARTQTTSQGNSRRYLMVLFNPLQTEFQRKALSRIFHRTPLIRLRPGIVLLPQIRTRRVRLYSPSLLRPSEFISRLLELGAEVLYAPRLELVHSSGDRIIVEVIQSNLTNRAQRIVKACRSLFMRLSTVQKENGQTKQFSNQFRRLRSQMRLFRKQVQFFHNEFGIDLSNLVNRVASAITRVHHRLNLCDASK
ncbi:MAG: hypothetical protein ACFFBR_08815 [Promethearchaeota archaeon]